MTAAKLHQPRRKPLKVSIKPQRLHKLLAAAGAGSRRGLEKRIANGEIRVNGERASIGQTLAEDDVVELDGKTYRTEASQLNCRVLMYHKPVGEVTTRRDPEGRKTVFDNLPAVNGRWIAVGRLDINTAGLLLLTNDGDLANALMHPSTGVDREYACRVHGDLDQSHMDQLLKGVELEDGMAQFSDIQMAGGGDHNRWFHVCLMEGRNREVRRMFAAVGAEVSRLKRVRYGPVFLPAKLRRGHYQELNPGEVKVLRTDIRLPHSPATELHLVPQKQSTRPAKSKPRKSKRR